MRDEEYLQKQESRFRDPKNVAFKEHCIAYLQKLQDDENRTESRARRTPSQDRSDLPNINGSYRPGDTSEM